MQRELCVSRRTLYSSDTFVLLTIDPDNGPCLGYLLRVHELEHPSVSESPVDGIRNYLDPQNEIDFRSSTPASSDA